MSATANRTETAKERDRAPSTAAVEKNGAAQAVPAASGGIKAYLPLIVNIILMPVLAYVMTAFVLVPKLANKSGAGAATEEAAESHGAKTDSHGAKAESAHGSSSNE